MEEAALVRKTMLQLRKREREVKEECVIKEVYTFWDADADDFKWKQGHRQPLQKGNVRLVGEVDAGSKEEEGRTVFLYRDWVAAQFMADGQALGLWNAVKAAFGRTRVSRIESKDKDVFWYCEQMDIVIPKCVRHLRSCGVENNILGRIVKEIGDKDRLGKRVAYLRDVADCYKKDQILWKPELVAAGLLKR